MTLKDSTMFGVLFKRLHSLEKSSQCLGNACRRQCNVWEHIYKTLFCELYAKDTAVIRNVCGSLLFCNVFRRPHYLGMYVEDSLFNVLFVRLHYLGMCVGDCIVCECV